jgi:four helix bundle protein
MDYQELMIYQRARETARKVYLEIKTWPKNMPAQEISRQLFRAVTSIGANIAEGHGRHEGAEYIHFLIIAQGSANEVDHWLNTSQDCGIGERQNLVRLINLNNETRKMLTASINTLRKKQSSKVVHESPIPYSPLPSIPEETEI